VTSGRRASPVLLDICVCTHDPRPRILDLAIRALARQSVTPGLFRVIIVDNASSPPISSDVLEPLLAAGHSASLTRESRPGLSIARFHAINLSSAPWMLFVDDDNELADDFVQRGLEFISSRDDVGCFGGRLLLPGDLHPPRWVEPYLPYLGIKDAGPDIITGAATHWGPWEPPGAGFWISRAQVEAYRQQLELDARSLELGRSGKSGLASCEDSLMARQSLALGLLNAYNPGLSLLHHLDPRRFRLGYLLRLMSGYGRSHVLLESVLRRRQGLRLATPPYYASIRKFLRMLGSNVNTARKKSYRFALGVAVYHLSLRHHHLLEERAGNLE
jgi:glycosyltransferase involved in cell wall biosynthesis